MVIIKTPEQIEGIRKSCQLLARVMAELKDAIKPGVTTKELEKLAAELIVNGGGRSAFKGYRAVPGGAVFPSALCTSVNEVVVHGPAVSDKPLEEGSIIGLDLGLSLDGYFSDIAITVPVGEISASTQQLLDVTKKALENGIAQMRPGNKIRDISQAIEDTVRPHGYGIIRDFVGHGVGLQIHEDPRIPNFVAGHLREDLDIVLKEGMVLAIEPMVTSGGEAISVLDDGWSVVTKDGSLAAHFEHTVVITKDGHDVLTLV